MKRTPLKRKTPLRANVETTKAWKNRSQKLLPARKPKRAKQEREYNADRPAFLAAHPVCPVTGELTTQVHHSARRIGKWLLLKRYWIAMSESGHRWVEDNGHEAELHGLIVKINHDFNTHMRFLSAHNLDPDDPVFYKSTWHGPTGPILKTSYGTTTT